LGLSVSGSEGLVALKPAPETVTCENVTLALPETVMARFCVALVPTTIFEKLRLVGFAATVDCELTILIVKVADAVAPWASVTSTVKVKSAGSVGVPEMFPDCASRASPGGSWFCTTDHVYGDFPPEAAKLAEYETPTVPEGREVVVTSRFPRAFRLDACVLVFAEETGAAAHVF
jgi:hypothetical protein